MLLDGGTLAIRADADIKMLHRVWQEYHKTAPRRPMMRDLGLKEQVSVCRYFLCRLQMILQTRFAWSDAQIYHRPYFR